MKIVTVKMSDGNYLKIRTDSLEKTIRKHFSNFTESTPNFRTGKNDVSTVISINIIDEEVGKELECSKCGGSGKEPCGPWQIHNMLGKETILTECYCCKGSGKEPETIIF